MTTHIAHAVTCESCGCTRECSGDCHACAVCGAEWIRIECLHCGPVDVYRDEPEYRAIIDVTLALAAGHAPLGAMTCPNCRGEVTSRQVQR